MPIRVRECSRSRSHTAHGSWGGRGAAGAATTRGHAQARGLRATTCTWAGTHPSAPLSATSTCHSTLGPSGGNPGVSCEQGAVALILGVTQRLQNCANSTVCLKTLLGLLSKVADNLRPKVAEPSPAASPRACGDCWPPGTVGTHFSRNRAGRCGESSLSLVETAGDQGLKAERRWRGYTQPRPCGGEAPGSGA